MSEYVDAVREHYDAGADEAELVTRVATLIDSQPATAEPVTGLAALDQFHVRGLAATVELARLARFDASTRVLDAGSGLGGPSRYLAATFGCSVRGIDLTPAFVAVSRTLSDRAGLSALASYQVGDLVDLPFADGVFDVVWTQHVVMNVRDRTRVYREFARVLAPGGTVLFYDVTGADGKPAVHYPVPWANGSDTSFLLTKDETLAALREAGLQPEIWTDETAAALEWFAEQRARPAGPPAADLAAILGPRFGERVGNLGRNLAEGRLRLAMGTATRSAT